MRRYRLLTAALLLAGCGNKMDLPVETPGGSIPFDGYFVYGVWENVGNVTDILVTENQWVYLAEDSVAVTRYKRKGANVDGVIVARAIGSLPGLGRPVYLDEGMEDHIFIVDLETDTLPVPPNNVESRLLLVPTVKLFDLYSEEFTESWRDAAWTPLDSFYRYPGRDSAKSIRYLHDFTATGVGADGEDRVYVAGRSFSYTERVLRHYEGGVVTSRDTSWSDSSTTWSVMKYESDGTPAGEAAGDGTGLGYGRGIHRVALSPDYLYFVDGGTNRVKINNRAGESAGVEWLDGTEIGEAAEALPFDLIPSGLGVDVRGQLYVSDGGNHRVLKYTSQFRYKERVDKNEIGLLGAPAAIAATDSLVYVFDEAGPRIVLFELPAPAE
ncbi:MAG: hypothetical protein ABIK65_10730 [Candidatus Eisenbacteria bacterium]